MDENPQEPRADSPPPVRKLGFVVMVIGYLFYVVEGIAVLMGATPAFMRAVPTLRLFGLSVACLGLWIAYYDRIKKAAPELAFYMMWFIILFACGALLLSLRATGLFFRP